MKQIIMALILLITVSPFVIAKTVAFRKEIKPQFVSSLNIVIVVIKKR